MAALVFVAVLPLTALAQPAAPAPVKQVPAGSTAQLTRDPQKAASDPDAPKSKEMLGDALSKGTRKTLQEAMDSAPAK